jgi:hypothetical protein
MTEQQKESLIKAVYDLLMEGPDMGMGDMGNCREASEQTVNNWIRNNEIKNFDFMKTRIYAIDLDQVDFVTDFTDEEFIEIAERQGKVWTLEGFERSFNNEEVSDQWVIRVINF